MPSDLKTPRVFVSSTAEDLKDFREAAKQALLESDCHPVMFEYWPGADNPPLDECLQRVDDCDLVLAVVAQRHGWTPAGQPAGQFKSITRLECERAAGGIDVIPFLLDEQTVWPPERTEDFRAMLALQQGCDGSKLAALGEEIQRNKAALSEFKTWLCDGRQRRLFTTPESLRSEILMALGGWRDKHPEFKRPTVAPGFDLAGYREWLRRHCEAIELLGLDLKDAQPVRLPQVYVPARVSWDDPDAAVLQQLGIEPPADGSRDAAERRRLELPLLHRLGYASLYVPGDPGAGKSFFCRWLALIVATGEAPAHPIPVPEEYAERLPDALRDRVPLLWCLRDLNDHKDLLRGSGSWSRKQLEDALTAWLDRMEPGGLTGPAWRALLAEGRCLLILDGVDELQMLFKDAQGTHRPRANWLSGLADALPDWQQRGNRILLTSRPYGLSSADRDRLGLAMADLQPLDEPLQQVFIRRWFAAVDPARAQQKSDGLLQQLTEREDLRELRQSPMLLTALCVKYDEGQRLPRDIYLLYHSLINQVLHSRYLDTTDQPAVRRRLAAVALGMHTGDAVQQPRATPEPAVSYDEVERILAAYAGTEPASEGGAVLATEKRDDLVTRSGLLLPRGEERAAFYHFSFQEYLAAERLFALDTDPAACLRQYAGTPEWRRTLMFLFCAVADKRPQAALDAVRTVLLPGLTLDALRQNPNPAWLLLECLEIAHARGWQLDDFEAPLRKACAQSLGSDLPPQARNTLWLSAGKLGFDRRPGVGVDAGGLPDIDWCPVEAGRVILEDDAGAFDVAAFAIARYPVTKAQFQAFIDAPDGYGNPKWWEPEWIEASWVDPAAPRPGAWTEPNAPRETVSWHEAVAFCRWLDHRFRERSRIGAQQLRLPTEWEWQQAATGGDTHREFPWAGPWDAAKLNSREGGLNRTTAVVLYPAGAAPRGALDIAGNVWEWCLNQYQTPGDTSGGGANWRVVRGGSWVGVQFNCRAAFRNRYLPVNRNDNFGFRVCLSSPIMKN